MKEFSIEKASLKKGVNSNNIIHNKTLISLNCFFLIKVIIMDGLMVMRQLMIT
jgi:hypothetical protein